MNTRHQWQSTQERVDELTGKISVKKRDNESIFKKQQEAIEENEGLFNIYIADKTPYYWSVNTYLRKNFEPESCRKRGASKIGKNDEQRLRSN